MRPEKWHPKYFCDWHKKIFRALLAFDVVMAIRVLAHPTTMVLLLQVARSDKVDRKSQLCASCVLDFQVHEGCESAKNIFNETTKLYKDGFCQTTRVLDGIPEL